MQAYHKVCIVSTSVPAGVIQLEVINLMTLGFLARGDKGCISDNQQIMEGKQHRDTVEVYQAVLEEGSRHSSLPDLSTYTWHR